jgi:hypothetical protein
MTKLSLLLSMLLLYADLFSQNTNTISGRVIDKQTNEILVGATVAVKGSSGSVVTNGEGKYLLTKVNPGKIILVITYVGYDAGELLLDFKNEDITGCRCRTDVE